MNIIGTAKSETLNGTAGNDNIQGLAGNDLINAGAGNDIIDGGAGSDTIFAGTGNDTVNGGDGSDIIDAGAGNDTVDGGADNDLIYGGAGDDTLLGNTGNDLLLGGDGNDFLDGGAGTDILTGGAGDDSYAIDSSADVIIEFTNGGSDTVITTLNSYTLGANLENLVFTGSGNFSGTGNALDNAITGGNGDDVLNGGAGNDALNGGGGNDTLDGGTGADRLGGGAGDDTYLVDNAGDSVVENPNDGSDTVKTTLASYILGNNLEDLVFTGSGDFNGTGNALDNHITGGSGNNTLDGGAGADSLTGGSGNDSYVVDNAGDAIVEAPNGGIDTVNTTLASYTLGPDLENLAFTGSGNFSGTGNALDNAISGGSGNDVLDGGAGADALTGGAGHDFFIFKGEGLSGASSVETVTDFKTNAADPLERDLLDLTDFRIGSSFGVNVGTTNDHTGTVLLVQTLSDTEIIVLPGVDPSTFSAIDDMIL